MAQIERDDALSLLARQDISQIVQEAARTSAALASFNTVRMSAATSRMPVLSALPTAGFVTEAAGATGIKPTSKVEWADKELIAEEIAVIVPVHENVLADSNFDVWGQVRPLVGQEFGRVLDGAVFFGVNKPATWTDLDLAAGAQAAGNTYTGGAGTIGDLAEDVNEAFAAVEEDGFDVNVAYTGRFLRARLRGLRDTHNQPIYLDNMRNDGAAGSIYGQDLFYVTNGAWDRDEAVMIAGDRDKAILGIRQDVTIKLLTEATVGTLNLAERDMVALRVKMRVAFAVATPVNIEGGTGAYPFAVLRPAGWTA